jgi:hypothetical protein
MLFTGLSTGGCFKNPIKKPRNKKIESIGQKPFVKWKNVGGKPAKSSIMRKFEFMPGNLA